MIISVPLQRARGETEAPPAHNKKHHQLIDGLTDMKRKWDELYAIMESSGNPKYMKLFGEVMKTMMDRSISYDQAFAEKMLEKLCAVKWRNYVTAEEAEAVIQKMDPQPGWTRDQWMRQMERLGLPLEEVPYYNIFAMYLTMSMKVSDSKASIAKMMGKTPAELTNDELINGAHMLALDVLKDKDGQFDLRKYFDL